MEKQEPKNLSIEQAFNYLKEKEKTRANDIKEEAKKAPISFSNPQERKRFLLYAVSMLDDISESAKNTWCAITHKSSALYSTKEVASMLKKLMVLRIHHIPVRKIANSLNVDRPTIEKCEHLAIRVVGENISKKHKTGIPIINGN